MDIHIGNIPTEDLNMSDDGYPVVRENDTCPHWNCSGDESLAFMRECWYCKYSDFRKDLRAHQTRSMCRCPLTRKKRVT